METDNRDIDTTWIHLDDGTYVEVMPWDLVKNAIENAVDEPSELLEALEKVYQDVLAKMEV